MRFISALVLALTLVVTPAFAFDVLDPANEYSGFCPQLSLSMGRGASDTYYYGQVTELQKFLADYFEISKSEIVSGTFGATTELYVQRFQAARGLEAAGRVGAQTLAAIAQFCPVTKSDLPTSPLPNPTQTTPTATSDGGSCSITVDKTVASDNDRITVSWTTSRIGAPILWRGSGGTARTIPESGRAQFTVGVDISPNAGSGPRIERFMIGERVAAGATPLSLCTVQVSIVSGRSLGTVGVSNPSTPAPTNTRVTGVPTLAFSATPTTVPRGQRTTLQWTAANAVATDVRCFLEYNQTKVELKASGVKVLRPTADTPYKMTCLNTKSGFSIEKTVRVAVTSATIPTLPTWPGTGGGTVSLPVLDPTQLAIVAVPPAISTGQSTTLVWNCPATNSTIKASLKSETGWQEVSLAGNKVVMPAHSTTYYLRCGPPLLGVLHPIPLPLFGKQVSVTVQVGTQGSLGGRAGGGGGGSWGGGEGTFGGGGFDFGGFFGGFGSSGVPDMPNQNNNTCLSVNGCGTQSGRQ